MKTCFTSALKSNAGKELFNMKKNKHGFEPKDERRPEPPIIRGAHLSDDESYAICDKCGATSGSWKFVAHGDGLKHYSNTYNCKCGQCITVKYRRMWVME